MTDPRVSKGDPLGPTLWGTINRREGWHAYALYFNPNPSWHPFWSSIPISQREKRGLKREIFEREDQELFRLSVTSRGLSCDWSYISLLVSMICEICTELSTILYSSCRGKAIEFSARLSKSDHVGMITKSKSTWSCVWWWIWNFIYVLTRLKKEDNHVGFCTVILILLCYFSVSNGIRATSSTSF